MDFRKRFSALLKLVKFMRLVLLYLPIKAESFSVVLFKTCFKVRSLFSVFFPPTIKSSTMTSHFLMSSNISVMAISKTTGADQTRATGNLSNLNPPKGVLNVVSQIYLLRSTWSGRLLTLHQRLRKLSLLTYLRLPLPPSLRGNVNSLFTALFKSTGSRQIRTSPFDFRTTTIGLTTTWWVGQPWW